MDWNAPLRPKAKQGEDAFSDYDNPIDPGTGDAVKQVPVTPVQPVKPTGPIADRSWADTAKSAWANAPQSAFGVLDDTARALIHPVDTANSLLSTGKGFIRKAEDYLNPNPSVREPADDPERVKDLAAADALIGDYKEKYGSMLGFKKRLAEDPFNIGMDVGSVIAPATAIRGVPGKVARATQLASDPIELAATANRKLVTPNVEKALDATQRAWLAIHSQKGMDPYRIVQEAGKIEGPEGKRVRGVVSQYMRKDADLSKIADTSIAGLEEIKRKASDSYRAQFADEMKTARPLDFKQVTLATKEMADYANGGHPSAADAQLANEALEMVRDRFNDPKLKKDIEGFDRMKIDIRNRAAGIKDPRLKNKVEAMANAAKQTIIDGGHEKYADMMENYQKFINQAQDLKSTLGTGRANVSDSTLIKNLMKSMKDDRKGVLMRELAETEAGKDLPYMIAGASLQDMLPHYAMGNLANLAPIAAAHAAHAMMSPASALVKGALAIPGVVSASPKIGGKLTQATGATKRGLKKAAPVIYNPITRQAMYQTGRQLEEKDDGRPLRKAGGRVTFHEQVADKLVAAAERAKKMHSRSTQPLLNTPDDMVAKALSVANRSI